ncbi:MAG: sensor domain-containing phosphodiesterase, partial [Thiomonas sp.]
LPRQGRWLELAQDELQQLVSLPGIRAALVFRPDSSGSLMLEAIAGVTAPTIQEFLSQTSIYPTIAPGLNGQRGLMGSVWFSGQRQVADAYLHDTRFAPWHDLARELGVRSAVALPVRRQGVVDALLFLLGAYPHQFSANALQVWLDAVQSRWDQLAFISARPAQHLDAARIAQLRSLLYENGLRMFIQPVLDLRTGQIVRVEALARLEDGKGLVLSPATFLPVFSDADLDVLFQKGLSRSLKHLREWREAGLDIRLSLNLAPTTLVHPDCTAWIERALRDFDIVPNRLTLELLESQTLDTRLVDEAIDRISSLGVQLAMDDLGSGYSSLNRLAMLPFDQIKIDQDLVKDATRNPLQGIALMRTVLQIGQDLECDVIAEGLENDALIEAAMLLGCGFGQGYGLARPMPAEELTQWASSHSPVRLPSGAQLHSWLGATTYAWRMAHDAERMIDRGDLDSCPLTRFFREQEVRENHVLHWHAQWHLSAFEKERATAAKLLMQWMAEQTIKRQSASKH